jgi:hypothetical protein
VYAPVPTFGRRANGTYSTATTLKRILLNHGPGIFFVTACEMKQTASTLSTLELAKLRRVALLARTRLMPTTPNFDHKYVEFAAPNINMKKHSLYVLSGYQHRIKNIRQTQNKNNERSSGPATTWLSKWFKKPAVSTRRQLPNQKLYYSRKDPERALRAYGFITNDDERAARLYIYHKTRAHGKAKHDDIDLAFRSRHVAR